LGQKAVRQESFLFPTWYCLDIKNTAQDPSLQGLFLSGEYSSINFNRSGVIYSKSSEIDFFLFFNFKKF
jgi:hypothetical protein